jgi:sarcosine oxidase subunit beta
MQTPIYDVIIIGAGSVGLPTALAMAQANLGVLVIDRAASPGQGSHKAAIGGVRATHAEPAKIRLCLRSLAVFSTWERAYGQDIEWAGGGYTFVAYREHEATVLKALLKEQQRHGLNIAWHDREALLAQVPALNAEGLLGGTLSPEDGACSPLLAGHAFYEEARRAGAVFHFNEAVTGITVQQGRVTGVTTTQGHYAAPVVVNAAGAWARQVGTMVGEDHPIAPDAHEAGITEPAAPFLDPLVVDLRPGPGSANVYFYQQRDGQVVFCLTPDPPIPGFDCRETSDFLPQVARRLVALAPRLVHLRVRRTWRGLYPMTPDGSPLVGWSRSVQGYLMAIGMCGQGFMLGPGVGELLARMVIRSTLSPEDRATLAALSPYRRFEGEEMLK